MLGKSPKYRKSISSSQVRLLELLFKFRFVSVPLLSEWLKKDKSTVYERLLVLVEQGYAQKQYDSSYRLPPRPAAYSLAAKGIKYLRDSSQDDKYSQLALRNMYKNRSASVPLVDHSLDLFKLCLQLNKQHLETFDIFTKSEMTRFDDFLRPLSDLYLRRNNKRSAKPSYLLEVVEAGTMTWVLKKRIQIHQEWFEAHEEGWDEGYPTLLFICENNNTEKRIRNIVLNSYLDFGVYSTTRERLGTGETGVWSFEEWEHKEPELKGL